MTPLHFACLSNIENSAAVISITEMLLKAGLDIDTIDYRGKSALHYAVVRIRFEDIILIILYRDIDFAA
jgi:ankyrin repeat protein